MEVPGLSHNSQETQANNYKHFAVTIANLRQLQGENAHGINGFEKVSTAPVSDVVISKEILSFIKLVLLERRFFSMSLVSFSFTSPQ